MFCQNSKILFVGDYQAAARTRLNHYSFEFKNRLEPNSLRQYTVIHDDYSVDQQTLDDLCEKSFKFIKIDDFNRFTYSKTDLVVNFRLGAESFNYDAKKSCLGLSYFPVNANLADIRKKNIDNTDNGLKNILVFIGGKDRYGIGELVINMMDKVLDDKIFWYVSNTPINTHVQSNQILSKPLTNDMSEYFVHADLVVSGGGLFKYEASYCCIPNISVSQTVDQHEDTKILASQNLTFDLGLVNEIQANNGLYIDKLMTSILPENLDKQRLSMQKLFHTDSTERLVKTIIRM